MRMSIGVPGVALYFEHDQVKPFIKDQAMKLKGTIDKRVVPAVLKGTCKVLAAGLFCPGQGGPKKLLRIKG